jgi:hypothetical protein
MAQMHLGDKITKTGATTREHIKQTSIHNYSIHGYGKGWLSQPRLPTISRIVSLVTEMLVYGREVEKGRSAQNRYGVFEHLVIFKHLRNIWPIVTVDKAALSTFHGQDTKDVKVVLITGLNL